MPGAAGFRVVLFNISTNGVQSNVGLLCAPLVMHFCCCKLCVLLIIRDIARYRRPVLGCFVLKKDETPFSMMFVRSIVQLLTTVLVTGGACSCLCLVCCSSRNTITTTVICPSGAPEGKLNAPDRALVWMKVFS